MEKLPTDNCDVQVDNEIDEIRLLWLINKIGEEKVRRSAKKYAYYPESKIFVSTLLKRFHLKVPVELYAPKIVPIYNVYLLALADKSAFKIGYSGDLPSRVFSFVRTHEEIAKIFELTVSVAVTVPTKKDALQLERKIKSTLAEFSLDQSFSLKYVPYGACGHTEWFKYDAMEAALTVLNQVSQPRKLHLMLSWPDLREETAYSILN